MFAVGMARKCRVRLGDLWWYTLLLFAAQRLGDVINMFVGLWLVPKYVPQSELGAVLPLSQFVSFIGIPLAIVATPFSKFLLDYGARGEYGKIKSLVRDVFICTGCLALLTLLFAYVCLPFLFARMRVPVGCLGVLIVAVSILSSVSSVFSSAVQGLKLYSATVLFNVLAAPLRLVLMLVFMPFRPLSGYFVGQGAAPGVNVVGAIWVLRRHLGRAVRAVPYLKEDGRAMVRYTIPFLVLTVFTNLFSSVDLLVIRHRLSDFESACYYMVSRFTDISSYLGSAFVVFLFPMVAGLKANSSDGRRTLVHSVLGTVVSGAVVAVLLGFSGDWLMGLTEAWRPYRSMSGYMPFICCLNVMMMACGCYISYETAQGRFGFLKWLLPISGAKMVFLYAVTGYTFFRGMLPDSLLDGLAAFNPCRFSFVLAVLLCGQAILTLVASICFLRRPCAA